MNPLTSRPSSLPDHGDAMDRVAVEFTIRVYTSGALSVHGPIEDKAWCLSALEHAKDAVRGHHAKKGAIIIPSGDVDARVKL